MRNKVQPNNSIVALKKLWGIIHWSLIRHKYLIPTFSIVQGIFAVAIICGMALLIPEIDEVYWLRRLLMSLNKMECLNIKKPFPFLEVLSFYQILLYGGLRHYQEF